MCNVSNKKRLMGEMHDCVAQGWFDMLCVTVKESLEIFVCEQCPALNDFVEQTGTVEWVRRIKLIIAHNSLTSSVVTGSFVVCNRKSHSSSVGRTRTTCGCCLSCIGVYVSVEHHWILLFDLNMLRTCTYSTLEYHILCQCTHLLYVLLCINPLSYVRPVILTKTNIYLFYWKWEYITLWQS